MIDIAWDEIVKCGVVDRTSKFKEAKIFKISKTFPVPKVNFFNFLNKVKLKIKKDFSDNVIMIGQGFY